MLVGRPSSSSSVPIYQSDLLTSTIYKPNFGLMTFWTYDAESIIVSDFAIDTEVRNRNPPHGVPQYTDTMHTATAWVGKDLFRPFFGDLDYDDFLHVKFWFHDLVHSFST